MSANGSTHYSDALIPPDMLGPRMRLRTAPYANNISPSYYETSEYLIGSVAVGIILLESNGTVDQSTENWDPTRESLVVSKINAGLSWLAAYDLDANVSFVYDVHCGVPTSYEPISHTSWTFEGNWIAEAMNYLGYPGAYYFTQVRDYINDLRGTLRTDWAFAIFVVDSYNDLDGSFADGYFAYAYLGGPFLVMTYDNDGYGIGNMDWVTDHEACHAFYATDEYGGVTETSGYLGVQDQEGSGCMMEMPNAWWLCVNSQEQLGWRDTDGDGLLDIVDTFPNTVLNPFFPDPTSTQILTYNGTATESPYPNQNPYGSGRSITINTITRVEFRIDGGNWTNAIPEDGGFDESEENFSFVTPSLRMGTHTIETRGINSVGNGETSYGFDEVTINADSMWIEESMRELNISEIFPGYTFNVTVSAGCSATCIEWQFWLLYDGLSYLNATRAGYTRGGKSEFFQNITTVPLAPQFTSHNATHNRVECGEAWDGYGSKRDPGYGSLCWIEFNVTSTPTTPYVATLAFYAHDEPTRRTYLVDDSGQKVDLSVYGSKLRFILLGSDVAITQVAVWKNAIGEGESAKMNITIANQGDFVETVRVTAFANAVSIWAQDVDIQSGNTTTLVCVWNISGFAEGNYTISAYASPVEGETDVSDNFYVDGIVKIDKTSPTIHILSPQNRIYYSSSILLAFILNEPVLWIGYSLDNQLNVTISGNITLAELSDGLHLIIIFANDTAGNTGLSNLVGFQVSLAAVWIEPSLLANTSGIVPGYKFNVTVWADCSVSCTGWQIWLVYESAFIEATRAGYTAGGKSEFFQNISTISVNPIFRAHNDTFCRVEYGESWGGIGAKRDPGFGTTCWVEFNVTGLPIAEVNSTLSFGAYSGSIRRTYLLDGGGAMAEIRVSGSTVTIPGARPRNIAISNVAINKAVVGQGYTVTFYVNASNQGDLSEAFNVTIYVNDALVDRHSVIIAGQGSATLTFVWNSSGFDYGIYSIKAMADVLPAEANITDNTFIGGEVRLGIPGDVNPVDDYVGIDDIFNIATHFGHAPPDWDHILDPIYDIGNDYFVGIDDIFIAASHFGQEE
jgi:hypothetical protein